MLVPGLPYRKKLLVIAVKNYTLQMEMLHTEISRECLNFIWL